MRIEEIRIAGTRALVTLLVIFLVTVLSITIFSFYYFISQQRTEIAGSLEREILYRCATSGLAMVTVALNEKNERMRPVTELLENATPEELNSHPGFVYTHEMFEPLSRLVSSSNCRVKLSIYFRDFSNQEFDFSKHSFSCSITPDRREKYGTMVITSEVSSGKKTITLSAFKEVRVVSTIPPVCNIFTLFVKKPVPAEKMNIIHSDSHGRVSGLYQPVILVNSPDDSHEIRDWDTGNRGLIFLGGGYWDFQLTGDCQTPSPAGESFQLQNPFPSRASRIDGSLIADNLKNFDIIPVEMGTMSAEPGWLSLFEDYFSSNGISFKKGAAALHLYGTHSQKSPTWILGLAGRRYIRANLIGWKKNSSSSRDGSTEDNIIPAFAFLAWMSEKKFNVSAALAPEKNSLFALTTAAIPPFCTVNGRLSPETFIADQPWGRDFPFPDASQEQRRRPLPFRVLFPDYALYARLMPEIVERGSEHYNTGLLNTVLRNCPALFREDTKEVIIRKIFCPDEIVFDSEQLPPSDNAREQKNLFLISGNNNGKNIAFYRKKKGEKSEYGKSSAFLKGDLNLFDPVPLLLAKAAYRYRNENEFKMACISGSVLKVPGIVFIEGNLNLTSPSGTLILRKGGIILVEGLIEINCGIDCPAQEKNLPASPLTLLSVSSDIVIATSSKIQSFLAAPRGSLRKSQDRNINIHIDGGVFVFSIDPENLCYSEQPGRIVYNPAWNSFESRDLEHPVEILLQPGHTLRSLKTSLEAVDR